MSNYLRGTGLFQVHTYAKHETRLLKLNINGGLSVQPLADYGIYVRERPCITSWRNVHVYLMGGTEFATPRGTVITDSVRRYSLADDSWHDMPPLNYKRSEASACSMKDYIYVFCGVGKEQNRSINLKSIEKLRAWEDRDMQSIERWQVIPAEKYGGF